MIDQRRVVHDASTTFAIGRELWKSREAGSLTNLVHFQRPLEILCLPLAGYVQYPLHVDAVVPHFERSKFCQISHAFSICPDRSGYGIRGLSDIHAETVRRDLHADHQAFDVPLPGCGKRLVKIVDVEVEVSFGRGKDAEIPEVRVATSLDPHADIGVVARSSAMMVAAPAETRKATAAFARNGPERVLDASFVVLS